MGFYTPKNDKKQKEASTLSVLAQATAIETYLCSFYMKTETDAYFIWLLPYIILWPNVISMIKIYRFQLHVTDV